MSELAIQEVSGGVVFAAKIVPGSSKTSVAGLLEGMLKVKVSAAPEKGKANKALLGFLAGQLGVKRNALSIIRGQSSPIKSVQVVGVTAASLLAKLGLNKQGLD